MLGLPQLQNKLFRYKYLKSLRSLRNTLSLGIYSRHCTCYLSCPSQPLDMIAVTCRGHTPWSCSLFYFLQAPFTFFRYPGLVPYLGFPLPFFTLFCQYVTHWQWLACLTKKWAVVIALNCQWRASSRWFCVLHNPIFFTLLVLDFSICCKNQTWKFPYVKTADAKFYVYSSYIFLGVETAGA